MYNDLSKNKQEAYKRQQTSNDTVCNSYNSLLLVRKQGPTHDMLGPSIYGRILFVYQGWSTMQLVKGGSSQHQLQHVQLISMGSSQVFAANNSKLIPQKASRLPFRSLSKRYGYSVMRRMCMHAWEPIVKILYHVLEQRWLWLTEKWETRQTGWHGASELVWAQTQSF